MIRLHVIDDENDHFAVSGDEPFRVEVRRHTLVDGVVAYVYRGAESDLDARPVGGYDSGCRAQGLQNTSWEVA